MRDLQARTLGTSGLEVSALGIGTAALATPYGPPGREREAAGRDRAVEAIQAGLEAGLTFIDTAPAYGDSESWVGEAAGGSPCLIATKLLNPAEGWLGLDQAATRSAVRRSVERSLTALKRNQVDLLQVHNADEAVLGRAHVLESLEELRSEGMVGLVGATVYGNQNALAAVRTPEIDVIQVAFSALDRRVEVDVVPSAADLGKALVARSVLLRGVLSDAGQSLNGALEPLRRAADSFRSAVGSEWKSLPGAAAAWALSRPGFSSVLLGPRDADELKELMTGASEFLDVARGLGDGWQLDLPTEMLDPTQWPAVEDPK